MSKKEDLDSVDVAIRWTVWTVALAFVAACLVTLLALWVEREARAVPLTPELEVWLYSVAYGQYGSLHGGISKPPQPKVNFDTTANICTAYGKKPDCPAEGYFDNGEIVMAYDLDFSNKFDASKLVHEMVHYLQEQHAGKTKDCTMWLEREWEAYRIQHYLLVRDGEYVASEMVRASARQVRCKEPETQ